MCYAADFGCCSNGNRLQNSPPLCGWVCISYRHDYSLYSSCLVFIIDSWEGVIPLYGSFGGVRNRWQLQRFARNNCGRARLVQRSHTADDSCSTEYHTISDGVMSIPALPLVTAQRSAADKHHVPARSGSAARRSVGVRQNFGAIFLDCFMVLMFGFFYAEGMYHIRVGHFSRLGSS